MTVTTQYRIEAGSAAELVRSIERGVAAGLLAPGQRLPSVRRLAEQVGLSPVTVSSGLAELRRRGVVITEQRRGSRIGQAPPIGARATIQPVPAGARDLSRGNPDPQLLPDAAAALAHAPPPPRLYGEAPVLEQLAGMARERLARDGVDGEALCVVSGALDGIERVLQAHLRPGDRIAVENPGYAALYDLLRAQGLVLEPVAVDDRGMLPAALATALAAGASAVAITPRGQNPTGATLDARRARELRAVLASHPRALLIEDDHLGAVAGAKLHTLTGASRRWAATRSVAKALGPDIRLAVLCGDPDTVARVQGRQQCGPGWVSHVLQSLVLTLWRDPDVQLQIARASEVYSARRRSLLAALRRRGVHAHGAGGLNVWVPVPEESGVVGALLQRGWAVAPGASYRLAGSSPAIRITIATLREHEATVLAADLADVLDGSAPSRSG